MNHTALGLLFLASSTLLAFGCSSESGSSGNDGNPGTGAVPGTGALPGTGGTGVGGMLGTGATPATGGTTATGGMVGVGGATGGTDPGTGGMGTGGGPNPKDGKKRVVGYIPTYRDMNPFYFDLDTLTHLCIAFANPDVGGAGGTVDFDVVNPTIIPNLIQAAHEKHVRVLASIAGAGSSSELVKNALNADLDGYVTKYVELVNKYNLDGLDVDIEGNPVQEMQYESFISKLRAALPQDKLLTAAVANWNGYMFPDGALSQFDFINVMAYDACPFYEGNPCEHSTIGIANEHMSYWVNDRGIAADKMVLGVPFYAYCWGASCPGLNGKNHSNVTYAELLASYPTLSMQDYFEVDGKTFSHNSPATIAAKVPIAKQHGGIMIWELGQDAQGDASLFKIIADNQ